MATTRELEQAALDRGLDLDEFRALPNNTARQQALDDYDADARQVASSPASADVEPVGGQLDQGEPVEGGGTTQPIEGGRLTATDQTTATEPVPADVPRGEDRGPRPSPAPYPSEQDLKNRLDAAAGTTEFQRQVDEADVPPVGGNQADDSR